MITHYINDAKKQCLHGFIQIGKWECYSPAYVITNENVRYLTQYSTQNKQNARVLSVVGSGDAPFFYALNGAKEIDTFDITYNAYAVMDIKRSAIQNYDLKQYEQLLSDLHDSRNVQSLKLYKPLIPYCDTEVHNYIKQMDNDYIFTMGRPPVNYKQNLPTPQEYQQLKNVLKQTPNFIWTDLEQLSGKITGKYDCIYLSNIFQYQHDVQKIVTIINDLRRHLKDNGIMVIDSRVCFLAKYYDVKKYIPDLIIDNIHLHVFLQQTR